MLTRLGESYGKGAKKESARRRSDANANVKPRLEIGGTGGRSAGGGDVGGEGAPASSSLTSRKLTKEEIGRFAEVEEVPSQDEEEEDEWDLGGDT